MEPPEVPGKERTVSICEMDANITTFTAGGPRYGRPIFWLGTREEGQANRLWGSRIQEQSGRSGEKKMVCWMPGGRRGMSHCSLEPNFTVSRTSVCTHTGYGTKQRPNVGQRAVMSVFL
jgi:hypothetical protein